MGIARFLEFPVDEIKVTKNNTIRGGRFGKGLEDIQSIARINEKCSKGADAILDNDEYWFSRDWRISKKKKPFSSGIGMPGLAQPGQCATTGRVCKYDRFTSAEASIIRMFSSRWTVFHVIAISPTNRGTLTTDYFTLMLPAGNNMIIHHPRGLHIRITYR